MYIAYKACVYVAQPLLRNSDLTAKAFVSIFRWIWNQSSVKLWNEIQMLDLNGAIHCRRRYLILGRSSSRFSHTINVLTVKIIMIIIIILIIEIMIIVMISAIMRVLSQCPKHLVFPTKGDIIYKLFFRYRCMLIAQGNAPKKKWCSRECAIKKTLCNTRAFIWLDSTKEGGPSAGADYMGPPMIKPV